MKAMMRYLSLIMAGFIFSTSANAKPAPRLSTAMLTLTCQEAARDVRDGNRVATAVLTPLEPIHLRDDYTIQVFSFKNLPRAADKTIIGIIEKSQQSDVEVPQFTSICIGGQLQPPHGDKDTIYFVAHQGDHVPIHFHLNKKVGDSGYLAIHNWAVPGSKSLAMSGPFLDDEPTKTPQQGELPKCLKARSITVGGANNANLSFDFDPCLAGNDNYTYEYLLFVVRKDSGGSVTVPIDPQIINHPH